MKTHVIHLSVFDVSIQAALVIAMAVMLFFAIVLVAPGLFPYAALVSASLFLFAYNLNCTVVGHCNLWAWLGVLEVILIVATPLTMMYVVGRSGGTDDSVRRIIASLERRR